MVYQLFLCTRGGEFHIQSATRRFHIHKQAIMYKTTTMFILLGQARVLYQFLASAMLMVEFDKDGPRNDRVTQKTALRKTAGRDHLGLGLYQQAQESRSLLLNGFLYWSILQWFAIRVAKWSFWWCMLIWKNIFSRSYDKQAICIYFLCTMCAFMASQDRLSLPGIATGSLPRTLVGSPHRATGDSVRPPLSTRTSSQSLLAVPENSTEPSYQDNAMQQTGIQRLVTQGPISLTNWYIMKVQIAEVGR